MMISNVGSLTIGPILEMVSKIKVNIFFLLFPVEGAFTDARQTTIFYRTLFVLFYCLAITQKPAKIFYIHLCYSFCRTSGVAYR